MRLDTENWKEYHLGDLFDKMYKAEAHVKGDYEFYDTLEGNTIRFISRTESNNGCDCYLADKGLTGIEEGNAIAIGDTTATCSYQAEKICVRRPHCNLPCQMDEFIYGVIPFNFVEARKV